MPHGRKAQNSPATHMRHKSLPALYSGGSTDVTVTPLKPATHMIFWGCASAAFILSVILFKSVLLPFVLGIAVAYLLSPVMRKFEMLGIARAPAALMILGGFLILISAFTAVLAPVLYRELVQFSHDLPVYIEKAKSLMRPVTDMLERYTGHTEKENLDAFLKENGDSAVDLAHYIVRTIAAGGQRIVDMITVAVFMPVVAWFMMKEWPGITRWVRALIPRHAEGVVMDLLGQIDEKLSGFVRGQITVAVFLGLAYALALALAGLKYGILIGLMSGALSVIPMVGSAIGLIVSVTVAWFQAGDIMFVLLIAAIFISGQIIEGNVLTPKLVGDSVGLHPLWVFFALLAGGSLLGVLGMFLAVPVAAVIGVLLSFALQKYKQSAYYRDTEDEPDDGGSVMTLPAQTAKAEQIPLDLGFRHAFGRADFHIGQSNRDAVAWIDRWPDWPAPVLVLQGPAASGKSHLAAVWRDISDAGVIKPENLATHTAQDLFVRSPAFVLDGLDPWLGGIARRKPPCFTCIIC